MIPTKSVLSVLTGLSVFFLLLVFNGCTEEEPVVKETTVDLKVKDVLGVSGTVTFTETSSTSVTVDIQLSGATEESHPVQLCRYSIIEDGSAILTLNPVDASGQSSTYVNTVTYDQLLDYDGCIKITKNILQSNIILAQCDIGGNVITTTKKSYTMTAVDPYGVNGTALFEKRTNGNSLVTVSLTGVIQGDTYPVTINLGSIASVGGGPVTKTLSPVDGNGGISSTTIRTLDSNVEILYDDWLVYDGYINIYQNTVALGSIICHGNIGSN